MNSPSNKPDTSIEVSYKGSKIIGRRDEISVILQGKINDQDAMKIKKEILGLMVTIQGAADLLIDFNGVEEITANGKETFTSLKKMKQLRKVTIKGMKSNSIVSNWFSKFTNR